MLQQQACPAKVASMPCSLCSSPAVLSPLQTRQQSNAYLAAQMQRHRPNSAPWQHQQPAWHLLTQFCLIVHIQTAATAAADICVISILTFCLHRWQAQAFKPSSNTNVDGVVTKALCKSIVVGHHSTTATITQECLSPEPEMQQADLQCQVSVARQPLPASALER